MSGSKRVGIKTGSRLTISVSLEGLADLFGNINLNEIVAYPVVYDSNDVEVHRPTANVLTNNQTELVIIITGEETANWNVNTQYHLDVLFYEATSQQRELSDTYYIDVSRGYARPPTTGIGTGSYDGTEYSSQEYNTGS